MGWQSGGKRVSDAASRASEAADYIEGKEHLINKFTGEQENLQAQVDKLVVEGDSSPAAAQAAVGADGTKHSTLKARLDAEQNKVTQQLAEMENLTKEYQRGLNYYWIPPAQPPARKDHPGSFTDAFNLKFQDYIDQLFEPLRLANPDYMTRSSLGKDESGTYDVWKYVLSPKNYEKTIIISGALHGSEVTLVVTMARLLHYLINEYEKYPDLGYIREKVRIIFIPFANPWGTSQTPRRRYNSNGVDLNRNWDYKWGQYNSQDPAFGHDYKGGSPFSEVETRYMRDLILSYPDAIAHLDLHNTGPTSRDYFVYLPENYKPKTYEQLVDYFTKDKISPIVDLNRNPNPSLSNYMYHVNGIPSAHPEWCDTMTGGSQYGSEEITKSLEWLANVIIEHCREFNAVKASDIGEPVVLELSYNHQSGSGIRADSNSYINVVPFEDAINIPHDGILLYEGSIVLLSGSSGCVAYVTPKLGQNGVEDGYITSNARWESYTEAPANTRVSLPFMASVPVSKTNDKSIGKAQFGLAIKSSAGDFLVARYRGRVTFLPSNPSNFSKKTITL